MVEHFWLCGDCHLTHDFRFSAEGHVSVARRIATYPEKHALLLNLVA
jgi:hypothetical protein